MHPGILFSHARWTINQWNKLNFNIRTYSFNTIRASFLCMYIIYIHIHVFRPSQDSSVWLGLTSREQLMSPECSKHQVLSFYIYIYNILCTLHDEREFGQVKHSIYRLVSPRRFFRIENVTVE